MHPTFKPDVRYYVEIDHLTNMHKNYIISPMKKYKQQKYERKCQSFNVMTEEKSKIKKLDFIMSKFGTLKNLEPVCDCRELRTSCNCKCMFDLVSGHFLKNEIILFSLKGFCVLG